MKCKDVEELRRLRKENKELKFDVYALTEYNKALNCAYETIKNELNRFKEKSNYHI